MPSATARLRQSVDQPEAVVFLWLGWGRAIWRYEGKSGECGSDPVVGAGRSAPVPTPCLACPLEFASGLGVGESCTAGPRWAVLAPGCVWSGVRPTSLGHDWACPVGLTRVPPQLRQCPRPYSRTKRLPNAAARAICSRACLCSAPSAMPSRAVLLWVGSPATFPPRPVGREVACSAGWHLRKPTSLHFPSECVVMVQEVFVRPGLF